MLDHLDGSAFSGSGRAPRSTRIRAFALGVVAIGCPPTIPSSTLADEASTPIPSESMAWLEHGPFAPGPGRILHFHGDPYDGDLIEHDYARVLGPATAPIGESIWLDVPGPRDLMRLLPNFEKAVARLAQTGRMLNLSLGFDDGRVAGFSSARDLEYVTSDVHDAEVAAIAEILARHRTKTLLRIGCEVNGEWEGNHPFVFPAAYRKLVGQFQEARASNVAFVFCVEPNGDPDIFAVDEHGRSKWYPGDDIVDWIGIDLFGVETFAPIVDGEPNRRSLERAARRTGPRKIPPHRVTHAVLDFARDRNKPVFIGECAPVPHAFSTPADDPEGVGAVRIFEAWFEPFVRFLEAHPEIQGVSYCSNDFKASPALADWGDSRIQLHPEAARRWREQLSSPRWVHVAADDFAGR